MANNDKIDIRDELDLTKAVWRPTSNLDDAIELAFVTHTDGVTYVAMRRAGDHDRVLIYTPTEWDAFKAGVTEGEFDLPTEFS